MSIKLYSRALVYGEGHLKFGRFFKDKGVFLVLGGSFGIVVHQSVF
jgi:hypothetical protein